MGRESLRLEIDSFVLCVCIVVCVVSRDLCFVRGWNNPSSCSVKTREIEVFINLKRARRVFHYVYATIWKRKDEWVHLFYPEPHIHTATTLHDLSSPPGVQREGWEKEIFVKNAAVYSKGLMVCVTFFGRKCLS